MLRRTDDSEPLRGAGEVQPLEVVHCRRFVAPLEPLLQIWSMVMCPRQLSDFSASQSVRKMS